MSLPIQFADYCSATLVASTNDTQTTILVSTFTGTLPDMSEPSSYFYLTVVDEASYITNANPPVQREVMKVTAYTTVATGYQFTVVRGIGTVAQVWALGAVCEIRPNAQALYDLKDSGTFIQGPYLTATPDASLVNSRTVTAGAGISITDGGPGGDFEIATSGSAALPVQVVEFTTEDLMTLNTPGAFLELVAAQGAGQIAIPTAILFEGIPGSVPFTTIGDIRVGYIDADEANAQVAINPSSSVLTNNDGLVDYAPLVGTTLGHGFESISSAETAAEKALLVNQPIVLWSKDGGWDDTGGVDMGLRVTTYFQTTGATYGAPATASFVTVDAEPALPDSRQIAAGAGISFADGGPGGTLTISAAGAAGNQWVNVFDYMTPAQIAAIQARTESAAAECTAAINAAITDVAAGLGSTMPVRYLMCPEGAYGISGTGVRINAAVMLVGAGQGSFSLGVTGPTKFFWRGTAGGEQSMVIYGGNGSGQVSGGGISRIMLDGKNVADNGLKITDSSFWRMGELAIGGCILRNLYFYSNPGALVRFGHMDTLESFAGSASTPNAHGIYTDGAGSGADGVTQIEMNNVHVSHWNGNGITIGERGDFFKWISLNVLRHGGTGFGVRFIGTYVAHADPDNAACDGHIFVSPVVEAGFYFDNGGLHQATQIIMGDGTDVETAFYGQNWLQGPGCTEVTVMTSLGVMNGKEKTLGQRATIHHDGMNLLTWASNVLTTTHGSWRTAHTNTGTVNDGVQPGGAIQLLTSANANDYVAVFNTSSIGTGGVSTQYRPSAIFSVVTVAPLTNFVIRCGFMDTLSNPPTNGIYVEANPAGVANLWTAVCRRAGTQTRVTTAFDYSAAQTFIFRIEVLPSSVCFYGSRYFVNNDYNWRLLAQTTTNIPLTSTTLSLCFQVITTDTAAKQMFVYDSKLGYDTEIVG